MEGKYLQDENPEHEPPETPAPVFAARALKSAIFGTPAPPDDTVFENETEENDNTTVIPDKEFKKAQSRSMSPTKPPGILLTPGTASNRRKTVSFGNEVFDKEDENNTVVKAGERSGILDPSPWGEGSSRRARKTSLTKTLENSRDGKAPKPISEKNRASVESQPLLKTSARDSKDFSEPNYEDKEPDLPRSRTRTSSRPHQRNHEEQDFADIAPASSDATIDLNKPHSQSGRFWKSEYEQYHEEALEEMQKLTNYKLLAKSYAKMKDDQATALAEKLEEEQKKVIKMENKISQLTAKIGSSSLGGVDDSTEMMKQLARQTALALQYKAEVEEFRAAMESSGRQPDIPNVHQRTYGLSRTETNADRELRKAREQLKDMDNLRAEVKDLRQRLANADENNLKLQDENKRLTQELLHAEQKHTSHIESCDKKANSIDGQLQRKDERFQNLQKDYDRLKEITKKSRRDTEQQLKKRHDQIVELRKEVASLRGVETMAQEVQRELYKKPFAHEEVIKHFEKQSEKLQVTREKEMCDEQGSQEREGSDKSLVMSTTRSRAPVANETPFKRESHIPVLSSISRPSKVLAPTKPIRAEMPASPRPRSSNRALSEIVNGANVDTVPPEGFGPVQRTPRLQINDLSEKLSSMSPEAPEMELPSPEPSLPLYNSHRAIHERNCHASPRPSMFNIASSPPKAAFVRPRTSELTKQRSNNNIGVHRTTSVLSTSRIGSRPKREIDPERMAAAQARLEEKKRLRDAEAQKENTES